MSPLNANVGTDTAMAADFGVTHSHIKDYSCFAALEACGFVFRLAASSRIDMLNEERQTRHTF